MEIPFEKNESIKEIQLIEKKILEKVINYCNKHSVRYSIIAGTLLGAVRHSGFIPWDDDIDIAMPRPDYDRFLDLVKKNPIDSEIKIISGDENDFFSLPFTKICNKNVMLVKENETHFNDGNEIWIDLFPIDGLGNDYDDAVKIFNLSVKYSKAIARASSISWKLRSSDKGIMGIAKVLYRQLFHLRGFNYYKRQLFNLVKKNEFDQSKYVALAVWGQYGIGEIQERKKFIKFETLSFEDLQVNVMGCWHEYLSGVYGDYMVLPPIEQRKNPHNFTIIYKNKVDNQ